MNNNKHTNGSLNPSQKTRPYNNQQQKEENLQNFRLCCPGGPQNISEGMCKEGLISQPRLRIKKAVEHESGDCTNWGLRFWHNN